LAFLLLPLAALFLRTSPGQLALRFGDPTVTQAIALSLQTSFTAVLLSVLMGIPVAYLLARRQFPLRRALDTLVDLPTVLPPAVAGVALLMAFGRRGLLGAGLADLGIEIAFTRAAVVLAQMFVAAPLFVKAAKVGFAGVNAELEQAAALDGASGWQIFRRVTLPLAWPGLVVGGVMTWARALGEFGATMIFAGNFPGRTQTMPLAIYMGFELDLNIALALSIILVGVSFLVLVIVKGLFRDAEPAQGGC
jgi:molybdate transport system permease protein